MIGGTLAGPGDIGFAPAAQVVTGNTGKVYMDKARAIIDEAIGEMVTVTSRSAALAGRRLAPAPAR